MHSRIDKQDERIRTIENTLQNMFTEIVKMRTERDRMIVDMNKANLMVYNFKYTNGETPETLKKYFIAEVKSVTGDQIEIESAHRVSKVKSSTAPIRVTFKTVATRSAVIRTIQIQNVCDWR